MTTEFFILRSNYKITFPRLKIPFVVKCHTLTLEQSHSFNSLKRFNSKTKYCSFFFYKWGNDSWQKVRDTQL